MLKRAYVPCGPADGYRALVDRLWPRGVSRLDARIDEWWTECAPSIELRKWFDHDPAKWPRFRKRYLEELESKRHEVKNLVNRAAPGPITLVYGARDESHNHAIVLREFMQTEL